MSPFFQTKPIPPVAMRVSPMPVFDPFRGEREEFQRTMELVAKRRIAADKAAKLAQQIAPLLRQWPR
jgi:hypothetical protein